MEVTRVTLVANKLKSMIRHKRISLGLTQQQLADKAGVTKNYVTMVERGVRKEVSFLTRVMLADALGIPLAQVLTLKELQILSRVHKGITDQGAESVVWQLEQCLKEKLTPTVPKTLSQVALRRLMQRYPENREKLEAISARLKELYR
jgi:transcriptional regulator with XRE-family HTH domain